MLGLYSLALLVAAAFLLYLYLIRNHKYWKNRNVAFIPPIPLFGNLRPLIMLERGPGPFIGDLYNAVQSIGQRFVGIFLFNSEPGLLIKDPELIKHIFVKDFPHFHNRNVECEPTCDPIGVSNLFVIRDKKWKYLRTKLSPTFTSGKIKQMFLLIKEVGNELLTHIDDRIAESGTKKSIVLEAKEVLAKYTTDVISTCAFGIQSNSLNDPNAQFRFFGRKIFDMNIKRALEVRAFFFMHWMAKTFKFVFLQKESSEFMRRVFWETITEREHNKIVRNDFIDTLIKLKNECKDQKIQTDGNPLKDDVFEFDGDGLVAQAALFFTAGFETTATTITMALYELALQPDIQDKLRVEIQQNLEQHQGELTYDGLFDMKYLDMVVSETLRKYPPMPFLDRICTQDYKLPDSDLLIRKGTPVFIALYGGLHYDAQHYPNPQKFDPERFTEENKQKRHPFSYLPFGEGPHICIGMRFGLMNAKTGLSLILSKFRVDICEKTSIPLEMDQRAIILAPKGGLYLKFTAL